MGNQIQKGRIDKAKCDDLYGAFLKNEEIDAVFVCGPEDMILGVKESMTQNGVDEKNVHFELFTAPGQKKTTEKV